MCVVLNLYTSVLKNFLTEYRDIIDEIKSMMATLTDFEYTTQMYMYV